MQKVRRYKELKKLKGLMREKNISYRQMASDCGMALNTFNAKINGYSAFDIPEAMNIAQMLGINSGQIRTYFA